MRPRTAPTAVVPAVTAVAAFLLLVLAAAPAQATGYRYWSYWLRSGGTWTYAVTGPAAHTPRDGDVEGWRFAVGRDAADRATRPRGAADFAAICGGTPGKPGAKRIALVIDTGTAADAPGGEVLPAARTACARVPSHASSADALAAVARPLRYDSAGILCAIGGYPRSGCGEQVAGGGGTDAPATAPTAPTGAGSGTDPATAGHGSGSGSDTGSDSGAHSGAHSGVASADGDGASHGRGGPSLGVLGGVAVILALVGAARWHSRGRRP